MKMISKIYFQPYGDDDNYRLGEKVQKGVEITHFHKGIEFVEVWVGSGDDVQLFCELPLSSTHIFYNIDTVSNGGR